MQPWPPHGNRNRHALLVEDASGAGTNRHHDVVVALRIDDGGAGDDRDVEPVQPLPPEPSDRRRPETESALGKDDNARALTCGYARCGDQATVLVKRSIAAEHLAQLAIDASPSFR
ncbi:hypothetical protein D3C87_1920870 [compost metagenome]